MKTKILSLFLTLILVSSCSDFLDQGPKTAYIQEEVFEELDNIEPTLTGLYTRWRDLHKDRGWFMFTMGTDEAKQGIYQIDTEDDQSGIDYYNAYLSPANNMITGQWDNRWRIIGSIAQVIFALENNDQDPPRRNQLLAEASFIRAAVNFWLTQHWGNIPTIDISKLGDIGGTMRPLPEVYAFIIKDLETAIEYLPDTQADKRRATKAVAQGLLGKVYLYAPEESEARDYTKAMEYFDMVLKNTRYRLVDNYADLFDATKPNSTESLYEFQFSNIWPDCSGNQWQMGSRAVANMDGNIYFGGYDLMMPTEYCYQMKSDGGVWEEGDVRRDASIRFDFSYWGQQPEMIPGFGGDELDPHIKKFEDIRTDGMSFWYSGITQAFIRLSDIYLNYAECLNETGKTSEAVTMVNDNVRKRAWGGTLPADKKWNTGMSKDEFKTAMLDERMRELSFEGWRRMDLIRSGSGNFVKLIKERNRWAQKSGTIKEFHTRYPIPITEIKENEDINPEDQNPGYVN